MTGVYFCVPTIVLSQCADTADLVYSAVLAVVWFIAFTCYLLTACRDPGLVERTAEPPDSSWRWIGRAQSYAPPGSDWAPEGNVMCRGYDHMCVWTGTLIGANNHSSFCCWACLSIGLLAYLIVYSLVLCET